MYTECLVMTALTQYSMIPHSECMEKCPNNHTPTITCTNHHTV